MRCQYCKGHIGFLRSLTDRKFCSSEHKSRGVQSRAKQARESMIYGDEDLYEVVNKDEKARQKHAKLQAQIIVVLSTVMIGVLAFSAATGTPGSGLGQKTVSLTGELSRSSPLMAQLTEYFKAVIPSSSPIKVHEDFRAGLTGWIGGRDSDWNIDNGLMKPGKLRVWKPSIKLSDYRMEFEGQIEKNALSWAFRAPDVRNYYASKIVVKNIKGSLASADIVRYAVLNGAERERVRLPLPISIRPDTLYHVQMSVRGDAFVTRVNGQVVDTWSDTRIKRGGIGFFNERGEQSSIHWVDVREEREGLFGRLFAMGFFIPPTNLYNY